MGASQKVTELHRRMHVEKKACGKAEEEVNSFQRLDDKMKTIRPFQKIP